MLLRHQLKAKAEILEKLEAHSICLLEGQTRSGKSLTALSVAEALGGRYLFLTTKKALKSVRSDFRALNGVAEMVLINYHSAHKVEREPFDLVILDECHSSGLSSRPKQGKIWKQVRELIKDSKRFLLMSGTVAIESKAQLFPEFAVTGLGPWAQYRDFYAWWKCSGSYKDGRLCGGYGIQDAVKSVGSNAPAWGSVPDYDQVDEGRIKRDVDPFVVEMKREGFEVENASLIPVTLKNEKLARLIRKIRRDNVVDVTDEDGNERSCVFDKGPASVLTACHIAGGGVMKDESGEWFVLGDEYSPRYRIDWIIQGIRGNGKKYAVHSAYIFERDFIKREFEAAGVRVYQTYEEMRDGQEGGAWVDSLESFAEGVNLAWLTGSQIIYTLTWKGSKFSQVCDRQLNFKRKEKAKVAIPLLEGGIDSYVYEAVSNKRNFNASVL
jgi:hypothetical protein